MLTGEWIHEDRSCSDEGGMTCAWACCLLTALVVQCRIGSADGESMMLIRDDTCMMYRSSNNNGCRDVWILSATKMPKDC